MNSQLENFYSAKEIYKNFTLYKGKIVKKNLLKEIFMIQKFYKNI